LLYCSLLLAERRRRQTRSTWTSAVQAITPARRMPSTTSWHRWIRRWMTTACGKPATPRWPSTPWAPPARSCSTSVRRIARPTMVGCAVDGSWWATPGATGKWAPWSPSPRRTTTWTTTWWKGARPWPTWGRMKPDICNTTWWWTAPW